MTRPESIIRQLAEATLAPIFQAEANLRRTPTPSFPETPAVRAAWRAYRASKRQTARLEAQLKRLHAHTYSSNGKVRMQENTAARNKALGVFEAQRTKVRVLKQAAMLAVLGLDAAKARPIVLKFKADLEKVARGK